MDRTAWPALKERLAAIFKAKTRDEWCELMEGTDVCFAPVLSLAEAPQHPHNVAPRARSSSSTASCSRRPAPRFSRTPGEVQRPPAHAGQHTDEVLADWGLDADRDRQAPRGRRDRVGSRRSLALHGDARLFHAHPDDESIATGGTHGQGGRRRATACARRRHQGRARRGGRGLPRRGRGALGSGGSQETRARRPRSSGVAAGRVPRLRRLRDDGHARERPARLVLAGRRRGGRRARWPPSSARSRPTSSPSTTTTAATATPTTSRCTGSGVRAAELAGTPRVFEATMNRDHLRRSMQRGRGAEARCPATTCPTSARTRHLRRPEAASPPRSTSGVRSTAKRAAMRAHASQIAETSFFLAMPDEAFAQALRRRVVHPRTAVPGRPSRRRPLRRPRHDRGVDPHRLAQQLVFGAGSLRPAARAAAGRSAPAGRCSSPPRAGWPRRTAQRVAQLLGRTLASTFDEVAVARAGAAGAAGACSRPGATASTSSCPSAAGSCADLGKAVCFFLEQEAGMPGASHVDRPALPHISIPTTYSGAELTPFFGMTDPGDPAEAGGRRTDVGAGRRDLRPRAHASRPRRGCAPRRA